MNPKINKILLINYLLRINNKSNCKIILDIIINFNHCKNITNKII